jgi:hypothetical protein
MKRIKYSADYIKKRVSWWYECWAHIKAADYHKATTHAKLGFKLFPDDTIAEFTYYSIMADYALSSDTPKFIKMHKAATDGMKKLFKKTSGRGISKDFKITMKNEYYYQTKQYKKQYYLGANGYKRSKNYHELNAMKAFNVAVGARREVSRTRTQQMYSAGVGSAYHALDYARKKNKRMAYLWAQKSVDAWEIYFKSEKKYYNPYVHYGLALGILGRKKEMMKALKTSSKLCKKPMSYREFSQTIEWVEALKI